MYLTHFPDESAAIRICHADTVMFFLRSIVDQLVVLSNGNSSVEIIGTILSRETDEREDMDIEERMRADGRVNLDKPIQTPSPIFLCSSAMFEASGVSFSDLCRRRTTSLFLQHFVSISPFSVT
ncbi:hypothetical protein BLNAU_6630 [Blattamonas nauphoetae]|uniref:Uncharacterized protein n=1 Tax=Blattamonas nauphoetae TaxID=2049346 RepID=A0ABQ9Y3M9_9EUKA|nr:hypothetical protein BLNAU_24544 [Blattamonas nauphoetae]KAK2942043.1 hypothetical protein BLNAU_23034 [Blattamonas nauphoetae]KAK2958360.1 hypothetical protein BLNAU_6630 [Blattamonas nauphoetae]